MKRFKLVLATFLIFFASNTFAQEITTSENTGTEDDSVSNLKKIAQYLFNLGSYIGYPLDVNPLGENEQPFNKLLELNATQAAQTFLFNSVLGAIPVNSLSAGLAAFVPQNVQGYSAINSLANYTFQSQPFSQPSDAAGGLGKISVSVLLDQQNFQNDPVSQAVLNILGTPNYTYCMNYEATQFDPDCNLLQNNLVLSNVVGKLPNSGEFFNYNYNARFISELNASVLSAPLVYSQESQATTSSSQQGSNQQGLISQNQAQAASNFIRFASGLVSPVEMPKKADYETLFSQATNIGGNVDPLVQQRAADAIAKFLAELRIHAAQSSVGLSNLYSILSKRMPQNQTGEASAQPTSQALSEFIMATRRIYNPAQDMDKQWVTQINTATEATIQKEIAILLSEINYQLYLSRMQDERILMTNSILLLQNLMQSRPEAPTVGATASESEA